MALRGTIARATQTRDAYGTLALGILAQARKDLEKARRGKGSPWRDNDLRTFFASEWFEDLCEIGDIDFSAVRETLDLTARY